jgi:hypothetical protein
MTHLGSSLEETKQGVFMKVIVAGSRNITDYDVVKKVIDDAKESGLEINAIIEGGARVWH